MQNIRNFSIIAHIDHGKSTLADRLIQICGGLAAREMSSQVLDSMDIEKERGITIKAQTASLQYTAKDGITYNLNLIDTPGHVDFSYEVSRSLSACEGALLVVDASQGVEAQTVANCYTAVNLGVEIIPVLNKLDLLQSDPVATKKEIEDVIGIDASRAIGISAKTGDGVEEILEAIVKYVPPPGGKQSMPLQALIIDSWFNNYFGVVMLVRIFNGTLKQKDKILAMGVGTTLSCEQVGIFTPKYQTLPELSVGNVGFIVTGIKDLEHAKVGDTLTLVNTPAESPLPGFEKVSPQVFAGFYPLENSGHSQLRDSLKKLRLNDSALAFEPEVSQALGSGFRCGFLGLLHMEIVQERLEREFNIDIIATAPSVVYEVLCRDNSTVRVESPSCMPKPNQILEIREPIVKMNIFVPQEHIGSVMLLCRSRRGAQIGIDYHGRYVSLFYNIPLSEVILDFFDKLKSASRGYASMNYELLGHAPAQVVRVDLLVNFNNVDALSIITHRDNARPRAKEIVHRICKLIPRQMFSVAVQAVIGAEVIAREDVKALRKNVLAKCYGGDITRKKKLLEKQKAGKKRMKKVGNIEIPQMAFSAILKTEQ